MRKLLDLIGSLFLKPATAPVNGDLPPEQQQAQQTDIGLFDIKDRLCYRYRVATVDGKPVYKVADPMDLWIRVMDHGPELSRAIKVAVSELKVARQFYRELDELIRKIFDVPPFSEGGLDSTNCIRLYSHYMAYAGLEKKSTDPSPIPSPPEGEVGSPDSSPSTGGGPTSENTSGSGSTGAGPETNKPGSSSSA